MDFTKLVFLFQPFQVGMVTVFGHLPDGDALRINEHSWLYRINIKLVFQETF